MKILNKPRKFYLFVTLFIALSLPVHASQYYVDQNHARASDDNSGSEDQPWLTVKHAAKSVSAGDTVFVKNGTYIEAIRLASSGSPNKYITFRNYPGHSPIIDGAKSKAAKLIDWRGSPSKGKDKNYIIFDGFEVRNAAKWAFWIEGDHSIIRNCVVHDTGHTGIIALDSDYVTISNNEIYNTGWNGMSLESGNYATVEYNVSHSNPHHFGINIFPKTNWEQKMETGNNIRFNITYGNMGGIYTRYQQDNEIVGNLIYKNLEYGIFLHGGAGGPKEYVARTKIYQNTVADNVKGGIYNVNATHLTIKNNIFAYHAIHDFRYELQMNKIQGHDIDYNLYYTTDPEEEFVYWGGDKYNLIGFRNTTAHSENGRFAKPEFTNKSKDNYDLAVTSPAINSGMDLGVTEDVCGNNRPMGGNHDLGACEHSSDANIDPKPPTNIRLSAKRVE